MHEVLQHPSLRFVPLSLLTVFLSGIPTPAADISVSPAVISNDYRGMVILQIGGLTNGEIVRVEKFADFNGNGSVDGDDFLMGSLWLTDGFVSTIGGATNFNVPSDVTGPDGAITAPLNFVGIDIEHVVGQYTFRATGPGHFTNTASFTITNSAHAQSISGVVRCGTTNLSNALVVLLSAENDYEFSGGTVADTSGNYSFKVQPGLYAVLAIKSNYVYDFGNPPIVNVASNANIVTNLSALPATTVISGKLADWVTTNGLPGVFGVCESTNGLLTAGWTGPDGEIQFPVTSNVWRLEADSPALARLGYVCAEEGPTADTMQSPVTNLLAQLPKATAMFYGTVTTGTGSPLAGVQFWAGNQQPDELETEGLSDTNGNYSLGILGGQWQCSVSDNGMFRRAYVFTDGTNATVGNDQAIRLDFVAKPVTGRVSGWVKDQTGSPVGEIGVYSHAWIAGRNYSAWAATDGSGNYSMNVADGSWHAGLNCSGDEGLENQGYECAIEQVVSVPPTNVVLNFTVYPLGTPRLDSPGFTSPGHLYFALYGRPGTNYIVQVTTNLANPAAWSTLTNFTPGSGVYTIWDFNATNRARFYRARIGP
jgi:hypothetical protein